MELTQIKNALDNIKGGQYVVEEHQRQIALKKGFEHLRVEKYTKSVIRLKCNYQNLNEIKIKDYTPSPTHQNNNMEYIENYENSILYNTNNKQYYLKCTKSRNPKHKTITKWFLNGVEVAKQTLIELNCLYAKDMQKSSFDSPVFNINIKDITRLGNFS